MTDTNPRGGPLDHTAGEAGEVMYTPPPWHVVVASDGDTYVCGGEPREDGLNPICAMDDDPETTDDNALLIATAPALYEVLRDLVDATPVPVRSSRWRDAWLAADAVLGPLRRDLESTH